MIELENPDIIIRNYKPVDWERVRDISVQTSIFGEYKNEVLNEEIIADLLTNYFIEYEPQSCFVAEQEGEVIGYLLGSCDVLKMRQILKRKVLPVLVGKVFQNGLIFRQNNLRLVRNLLSSYFKGEFNVPDFSQDYPATLHINIAAGYRGRKIGSILVKNFLDFISKKEIKGIHFGVLSEDAKRFFLKLDFEILFNGQYTFLSYLNGKKLPHYIMGKNCGG